MRSPSMPNLFLSSSSPSHPPVDLHGKLQAETPHRSKTDAMNCVMRTFSASKALNQVLGIRDPEPFVPPPFMPVDLTERFEVGLQGYEQLYAAGMFTPRWSESFPASVPSQQGKTKLADILEERESPVRTNPTREPTSSASSKLEINVPKWIPGKHATAAAQRYTFVDSDSDAVNDTASQHTDFESDDEGYSSWKHGSSTTLAVSDYSRPGSVESVSLQPVPPFPPRTSSLLPLPNLDSSDATVSPSPRLTSKKPPPGLHPASTQDTVPAMDQHVSKEAFSYAYGDPSLLKRSESLPVLSLSPGVELKSGKFVHNENTYNYHEPGSYIEANDAVDNAGLYDYQDTPSPTAPRITVQAPSPVKAPNSRKRAPYSSTQNNYGPVSSQRALHNDTVGLPILSPDEEAQWKLHFPGNTHALLTILLTWSHAMWTLFHRLPDPKLFSIHPAFAYPVTPPVRKQLLSVSLYDTSAEPHKEVRFLGPGDAAEMSYHEVDVFDDRGSRPNNEVSSCCNSPIDTFKQTFGLTDNEACKDTRYMSMSQRAKSGEGRWCYVLIKGNNLPNGSTPPHLILAWHISALTATSDCLHTVYLDHATSKPPALSRDKIKRFSSLQNLRLALRGPAKFNFYQILRSASSSSELPLPDTAMDFEQEGRITLQRTVLKMEKAGSIPLIEGYRVDVAAFRDWMDACGKGEGKVILWRE